MTFLPDDDDYRRGCPTNHKKFGEAMALLAVGDVLFLDPYALIAQADLPSQDQGVDLIANLSLASG